MKYGTEEGSYTLDASPTQTEVGTQTVYYQVTADNYTTYTGSATLTVSAKSTQTIIASDVTAAYGDTNKKIEATTEGNGAISYAVKDGSAEYIDVNASTGALTTKKVGTATVIVTAAETATYVQATKEVTVTINKANAVPATVTANNRTYDGTEKPLVTVTGTPTGGEMQYALGENATTAPMDNLYTTSIPAATNAGTYYVWYKVVGDSSHADSTPVVLTATIAAPTPSVKFDTPNIELKAGETAPIKATVVPEGTTVTWTTDKEEVATVDNTGKVTAVGEGTAKIKGTITVEGKEYSAECEVKVTAEPTPTPAPKEIYIEPGMVSDDNLSSALKEQGYTAEKAKSVLEERLSVKTDEERQNSSFVDARPMVRTRDGSTREATSEDLVNGTIDVLLPYPDGTNGSDFSFQIAHLVSETVGGVDAGTVETPGATNTDAGIATTFHGLSPVLITWVRNGEGVSSKVEDKPHVHTFAWDTVVATEVTDGEMRYQCTECGHILERVPISAYYVFNKNTTEKIRAAKQGATVKVETDRWISFHKMVMEALKERPDVSLEVSFLEREYKGNRVSFTIPAAADTSDLFKEDNFAGFMYLGNKYGLMSEEN